jgi:hypothetical protein
MLRHTAHPTGHLMRQRHKSAHQNPVDIFLTQFPVTMAQGNPKVSLPQYQGRGRVLRPKAIF